MNRITFDVNNRRTLVFEQEAHDGPVTVYYLHPNGTEDNDPLFARRQIPAGQAVMMNGLYWHIMNNDIQNDFINYYGKNEEERTMRKTIGTPKEYAEAVRRKLAAGETIQNLNTANHLALELKTITMDHFKAAAKVLTDEILKR